MDRRKELGDIFCKPLVFWSAALPGFPCRDSTLVNADGKIRIHVVGDDAMFCTVCEVGVEPVVQIRHILAINALPHLEHIDMVLDKGGHPLIAHVLNGHSGFVPVLNSNAGNRVNQNIVGLG